MYPNPEVPNLRAVDRYWAVDDLVLCSKEEIILFLIFTYLGDQIICPSHQSLPIDCHDLIM